MSASCSSRGERTLNDLVRTAIPQAEQERLDAVERGIPKRRWSGCGLTGTRSVQKTLLDCPRYQTIM
jgi:hypothetical protein